MEYIDIENKLYQILDGKYYLSHEGQEYISVPNTVSEKNRASILYQEVIDDLKFDSMLSWSDAIIMSEKLGIWTSENEKSLDSLEKMLENLKLEIYLNYFNPVRVKELKKKIKQVKSGINKSQNNKHTLYVNTKEYYASNVKKEFLLGLSICNIHGNKVFTHTNFWLSDNSLINAFTRYIDKKYIDPKDIRNISRSEPWRSMWLSQKGNCIGTPSIEWTEEQRLLVSFSRMYDNVYESMECPPDEVIKDDDMLDGWFIQQSREREKKLKEKATNEKFGNFNEKEGQELFIMANSKNDIGQIYNMNDGIGKSIVHGREQILKGSGKEFKHQDLPDVQRDLRMQANREWAEKMRR